MKCVQPRVSIRRSFASRVSSKKTRSGVRPVASRKPLDTGLLEQAFARYPLVATLEEHSSSGGLGGACAEWLADRPGHSGRLIRFGSPDRFFEKIGSQVYARLELGLSAGQIAARIAEALA